MKASLLLLSVWMSSMFCVSPAHAQDTLSEQLHDSLRAYSLTNELHFNRDETANLPFLNLDDVHFLAPGAYSNGKDNRFVFGLKQQGSAVFLDGMELDRMGHLAVGLFQSMTVSVHQRDVKHGFAGPAIFQVESPKFATKKQFSFTLNGDHAQQMNAIDAELLAHVPLGKIRQQNKHNISLLVSGRFVSTNNTNPYWANSYRVKESSLQQIRNQLFRGLPYSISPSAEWVQADDFEVGSPVFDQKVKQFTPYIKFTVPFTDKASLSLSSLAGINQQRVNLFENSMFNANRNPIQKQRSINSYLSWDHELQIGGKVLYYSIFAQHTATQTRISDPIHGDRFFDYGYVGSFTSNETPSFEYGSYMAPDGTLYSDILLQNGLYPSQLDFVPSLVNPDLAAYTSQVYSIYGGFNNTDQMILNGGLTNGSNPHSVYGLFNAPGTVYNGYGVQNNEKLRAGINARMQLGAHNIQFGFVTNHTTNSHYTIQPARLWSLMNGLTNFHLYYLDLDNPIYLGNNGQVDSIMFRMEYNSHSQREFDKNLREALGLPVDGLHLIQINSYDPVNQTIVVYDEHYQPVILSVPDNLYNLNLFSTSELLNYGSSLVDYAGYDSKGKLNKKTTGQYSFFDDYSIGADKTAYQSFYVADAFAWRGLKLEFGLRLDAFNAKRPVLKDHYSLYESFSAGNVSLVYFPGYQIPAEIEDHFIVYVDNFMNPHNITGFRNGDVWYNASGSKIDHPSMLDAGYGINPFLVNPTEDINSPGFRPEQSFAPYKTSLNLLPHIALDFALNKHIGFDFNYFSYTINPWKNAFKPDEFYFSYQMPLTDIRQNSALVPIRYGHLKTGIHVKASEKVTVNLSFLQQSVRNYIVSKFFLGAYPQSYVMYVNDKGKYFHQGVEIGINYVNPSIKGLQGRVDIVKLFVDKKSPDYAGISDLVVNSLLTYSLGNSPFVGGSNWLNSVFSHVTAGVYFQYRSGLPYIKTDNMLTQYYQIRPDVKLFNVVVNKDFPVTKNAILSVKLIVENLFNFRNIMYVHSTTGHADDDRFLNDPAYAGYISNQTNPESFRLLYKYSMNNPEHYGNSRLGRIGLSLRF